MALLLSNGKTGCIFNVYGLKTGCIFHVYARNYGLKTGCIFHVYGLWSSSPLMSEGRIESNTFYYFQLLLKLKVISKLIFIQKMFMDQPKPIFKSR